MDATHALLATRDVTRASYLIFVNGTKKSGMLPFSCYALLENHMVEKLHDWHSTGRTDGQALFLAELTQQFASSLDVNQTLKNAIDRFVGYLNAEAASIFLLEEDQSVLICRECVGPVDVKGLRLDPNQGIVGQAVSNNEPLIVTDVAKNSSFSAEVDKKTGFITRSILCVPLSVSGTCIGALELLNKHGGDGLFNTNDLQLAKTVASAAALAIHNARLAFDLLQRERVRREFELAREIQGSLLPKRQGDRFPVHGLNIPANEVSGDFFDFLRLSDGRVYFALGDVSGKGMNAALLMARAISLLRCLAKTAGDPGTLLGRVNRELCDTSVMGMFVTIIAGYLSSDGDMVEIANGGHPPALLRRGDGSFHEFPAEAPPLGVLPGVEFPSSTFKLGSDTMYLYTDGISESESSDGSQLQSSGLKEVLESVANWKASERLSSVMEKWEALGYKAHDDITLLLVESVA